MADIRGVELHVIKEKKPDAKGQSWKLRLVMWVADGRMTKNGPKLEKRNFFQRDDGQLGTGKADGLTLEDLEAIKAYGWAKIIDSMKTPPPVPAAPPPEHTAEAQPDW